MPALGQSGLGQAEWTPGAKTCCCGREWRLSA
jgi:hypothetical protein